jgi:PilZ domain-containing protein
MGIIGLQPRERRRWKRDWLNTAIRVLTPAAEIHAYGITVSSGGMYLFALANLPVGSQVKVEFKRPQSKELVRLSGTVRNRTVYLYGLEFTQSPSA